jgi:predicted phosphodiesterase
MGQGKTMFMLGPAGTWEFATHKTPVVLRLDLVLNNEYSGGKSLSQILGPIYELYDSDQARLILYGFLAYKIMLLLLMGAIVGLIHSNGGKFWRRNTFWSVVDSILAVFLLIALTGLVTLATIDNSPKVSATGYASEVSPLEFMGIANRLGGDFKIPNGYVQNQLRGMEMVRRHRNGDVLFRDTFYVLLMSDIHGNRRGLEIVEDHFLADNPELFSAVILAGDVVHWGTAEEVLWTFKNWPVTDIPVFFVGGNHEDSGSMRQLQKLGFIHLRKAQLSGLVLLGQDDPLAYSFAMESNESVLEERSLQLAQAYNQSEPKPSLIVVHDIDQAKDVIEQAKNNGRQTVVVYGHFHELKTEQDGLNVLVQAGTAGASGFEAIGRDPGELYTFQILEYTRSPEPKLVGVYSYSYDDGNDSFYFTRTPID